MTRLKIENKTKKQVRLDGLFQKLHSPPPLATYHAI